MHDIPDRFYNKRYEMKIWLIVYALKSREVCFHTKKSSCTFSKLIRK